MITFSAPAHPAEHTAIGQLEPLSALRTGDFQSSHERHPTVTGARSVHLTWSVTLTQFLLEVSPIEPSRPFAGGFSSPVSLTS